MSNLPPSPADGSIDDWRPTASWDVLRLRAALIGRLRRFFDGRGYLEVETPLLSRDTVIDRHIDPAPVLLPADPRQPDVGRPCFLQTSPEFHMKRLLAAGGEAIYQVTRSFRAGEAGDRHNPEFTIAEWYRRGDDLAAGTQLLSDLCEALLDRGPAERLSYSEAFQRYADVDPLAATAAELSAAVERFGIQVPSGLAPQTERDAFLDLLLVERIEPHLGRGRPTILYGYPASQAALAKLSSEDPRTAERFELYVDSTELANGYEELTDPDELVSRFRRANDQRRADGKPELPLDSRLLDAMRAGLPASSGTALGFDRVVMLAAGASSIRDVQSFPIDRA